MSGDKLVIAGGIIPEDDIEELKKAGVANIFGPGTPTTEIAEYVKREIAARSK